MAGTVYGQAGPTQSTPSLSTSQQADIERLNLLARIVDLEREVRRLKVELGQALEQAEATVFGNAQRLLQEESVRIQRDVEVTHPDYVWDPATGTFTPRKP